MLSVTRVSATPAKTSAGLQRLSFALLLSNGGGAAVRLNAPALARRLDDGERGRDAGIRSRLAAGTLLARGASASFTWQYDVSGSGTLSFSGSASGSDANSGTALAPAPASAGANTVQQPASSRSPPR